jgi:hypothetical protein
MEVGVFQFQYCLFFFLLYDVVISTQGQIFKKLYLFLDLSKQ